MNLSPWAHIHRGGDVTYSALQGTEFPITLQLITIISTPITILTVSNRKLDTFLKSHSCRFCACTGTPSRRQKQNVDLPASKYTLKLVILKNYNVWDFKANISQMILVFWSHTVYLRSLFSQGSICQTLGHVVWTDGHRGNARRTCRSSASLQLWSSAWNTAFFKLRTDIHCQISPVIKE